ncbi:hypothetical protein T08_9052 [Trichinella sp. T8]|nr:hypothetical protein T08_9052 [Trichinella sp. T8]
MDGSYNIKTSKHFIQLLQWLLWRNAARVLLWLLPILKSIQCNHMLQVKKPNKILHMITLCSYYESGLMMLACLMIFINKDTR